MFYELFKFIVLALSELAMLPALSLLLKNRRHFEMFVGIPTQ
jgi:hypothetical protein